MYAELKSVITTPAFSSELRGNVSGNASGTMCWDMNSSVISGTPRRISMNPTHTVLRTGRWLRRPSASAIPMGKLSVIPAPASIRLSVSPPQCRTSTGRNQPPSSPASS